MRLLLDTHALLWWWEGDRRLSLHVREAMASAETEIYVSAATAWEVATKFRIGKLSLTGFSIDEFEHRLVEQGFRHLPITITHARRAGVLVGKHRDPFDRILAAQSIIEELPIVTADERIADFGAKTLW